MVCCLRIGRAHGCMESAMDQDDQLFGDEEEELSADGKPAEAGVLEALDALTGIPHLARNLTHAQRVLDRPPKYAPFPASLDERLVTALRARGIEQLYSHQAKAIESALAGRDVVVVTPTASGKTLCFHVPVVQEILARPSSRALFLFPTKALAQDQYTELHDLTHSAGGDIKVYTFDGDTPSNARRAIRMAGHVVLTNPDMLHTGIMPHHTTWIKLFENLRYVVIDEVHHYRGVFGSHVSNVLRRLARICEFYGSHPQFICCSATIANPAEIAETLTGRTFDLIDDNGAPAGEKYFLFYNPPIVNEELGIRRGVVNETRRIATRFLAADVPTIVFARSRMRVEILLTYLRKTMLKLHRNPERIAGYRGGYLPNERRAIEQGVKSGALTGVVSTNALELGIDIGQLKAAIIAGYPGSVASTWQQAGRAGRKSGSSVVVLVASSSPLDQFLITHPSYFFSKAPESAIVNPDNTAVLANHIKCAAFELPFVDGEKFGEVDPTPVLRYLEEQHVVRHSGNKWYWSSDVYPSEGISLRSASSENFVVVNIADKNRIMAEVDYDSAPYMIHTEAIYMHMSQTFYIENLDWDRRTAYARPQQVDYYTDALAKTDIRVIQADLCESFIPSGSEETDEGSEQQTETVEHGTAGTADIPAAKTGTSAAGGGGDLSSTELPAQRLSRGEEYPLSKAPLDAPAASRDVPEYGPDDVRRIYESGQPRRDSGPKTAPDVHVPRLNLSIRNPLLSRNFGEVVVSTLVAKFKKIRFETHENIGYGDVHVPTLEMQTESYWLTFHPESREWMETAGLDLGSGLSGLASLFSNIVPLFVLCDPRDVVSVPMVRSPHDDCPAVYIYDRYPGGIGLSRRIYDIDQQILTAADDLVSHCGCGSGCPSCVGPELEAGASAKLSTRVLLEATRIALS